MKDRLVIVADLGRLRVFKQVQGATDSKPHLEMLDEFTPASARVKLSEQLTDMAGRFPKGQGLAQGSGEMSAGERHTMETELQRRLMKLLADKINSRLELPEVENCYLAASGEISNDLLAQLTPKARSKVQKSIPRNLSKIDPNDLLQHFETTPA
jgi:hypothetical protein